MDLLQKEHCVACRRDSPRVADAEIAEFKRHLPDWSVVDRAGIPVLERTYRFPDFKTALTFTQRIGTLAEQEGHHPTLLTEYGRVTVSWWTHTIKGLHRNDFIMAAKSDELAELSSTHAPSG